MDIPFFTRFWAEMFLFSANTCEKKAKNLAKTPDAEEGGLVLGSAVMSTNQSGESTASAKYVRYLQ